MHSLVILPLIYPATGKVVTTVMNDASSRTIARRYVYTVMRHRCLHRRLKPWPWADCISSVTRQWICSEPLLPSTLFGLDPDCHCSHLGTTSNHHRSTHIFRGTPCVKCRQLESKMRAFVSTSVECKTSRF